MMNSTGLSVTVTGLTAPNAEASYVRLRLSMNSTSIDFVVATDELLRDCFSLYSAAGALGETLLTPKAKAAFLEDVQQRLRSARANPQVPVITVAERPGWHGSAFVTPSRIFPRPAEGLVSRLSRPTPEHTYGRQRSLKGWQRNFRSLLRHNPLFLFAASVALMGPLLKIGNQAGCLFHFFGPTSIGKSKLMTFMGSVRGGTPTEASAFVTSWNRTVTSLEKVVMQANDGLLLLDDIRNIPGAEQGRAKVLHDAIFFLANGNLRDRATVDAIPASFRLVTATSDNVSLRALMQQGGVHFDEAMTVRLFSIPAERRYGVFDAIPKGTSAADRADQVEQRCREYYGTPMHAFLKKLSKAVERDEFGVAARVQRLVRHFQRRVGAAGGRQHRVAQHYGLAFAAGCLAIEFRIFPISKRRLERAITKIYESQLQSELHEATNHDPVAAVTQAIREAGPRIVDLRQGAIESKYLTNAAGFIGTGRGRVELWFTPTQFAALVGPLPLVMVCQVLRDAGLLTSDRGNRKSTAKNQTKRKIAGKRQRVYCLAGKLIGPDEQP